MGSRYITVWVKAVDGFLDWKTAVVKRVSMILKMVNLFCGATVRNEPTSWPLFWNLKREKEKQKIWIPTNLNLNAHNRAWRAWTRDIQCKKTRVPIFALRFIFRSFKLKILYHLLTHHLKLEVSIRYRNNLFCYVWSPCCSNSSHQLRFKELRSTDLRVLSWRIRNFIFILNHKALINQLY